MTPSSSKTNANAFSQFVFIFNFAGKIFTQTDKGLLIWIICLNIVPSLIIVPNLYLDKLFLDTLVANINQPNLLLSIKILAIIVACRFALDILKNLSARLSGYYVRFFMWKLRQKTEVMVGLKYASIGIPTLEDPKFKDRYQKIERESMDRLVRIAENYLRIPQHLVAILSSLSVFIIGQPLIILVSLISLIPSVVIDRKFIKKSYELDASISPVHRTRGLYGYFLSRTRSYMELRLLEIHNYLAQKIHSLWDQIINSRLDLEKKRRTASFLAGLVDSSTAYVLDLVFGIQALTGKITLGSAQAYVRAISTFKQNVTNLTTAMLELYENYLYVTDLVWFLELESPYFNSSGYHMEKSVDRIQFNDVWFKYPDTENWILKGVSFEILPKENIAIVGKNGAGKTTLVKLLCGFYTPNKGEILINGHKVEELNKPAYWNQLSVLFQEFEGYNITARESIASGKIQNLHDTEKITKFAQMTDIDDWIMSLPKGYDNSLARDFEGGVTPSTGQWQRIGIARALFREPKVLVLDEPTSNVDPEAEEQIFNSVLKYGKDKIIIFISHRFSTVRRADKIIVFEDGTVSELGSHKDLMKKKGTYQRLFTLQAKSYQ